MKVSFHLRKDKVNKDGRCPIRMLISAGGHKVFKVVKGVSVKFSHWDEKKERVKPSRKAEEYNFHIEYNKIIDELESNVKTLFRYIMLNDIPITKEFIANQIKANFKRISISKGFYEAYEEFIEVHKPVRATNTLKSYRTAFNFIKDFQDEKGFEVRFDTLTHDFFEEFQTYAFDKKNTLNNYFAKLIATLKTFLKWAKKKGYHENDVFLEFKASEEEIEVIYLTMDELMDLFNYEFDSIRLEKARDIYCMGCFTGMRFSDLFKLKTSNIFDDHILTTLKKKKTLDHKIPLNNFSRAILEKYQDTIFEPIPKISDVKLNKYIKECCEIVGIDTITTVTRYVGNKVIEKTVPKHELITSHTARKTFVTNSLILGMKEMVVRNLTNHKSEASFKRYVKIAEDFKKTEMDNTWNKL